jgi:serine/threonine protein kinase
MSMAPGTKLGPYEILSPLGAGGMGEVYRARDTRLGRDVAVKVLPQHLSANPEVRARFEREAKTVSSLNHPHICVLHDVGREGDTDYLVMELVEGETLAQRLTRGPLPTADVLKLGAEIADALDRAHRAGIVHRDLKPGNIMVTRSGAKLMDFGLARATGMGGAAGSGSIPSMAALTQSPTVAQPLTAEGTIIGTFQYMAPEQLEGKEADARSDVWAFGCVVYEMVTGKRAFEGKSQASLISAIMSGEPPQMTTLAPLTPPALERVVRQCLAKDPENRWQSAGDLKRALEWSGDPAASSSVIPGAVARPRRGPRVSLVVAAVIGAALASTAWWLWSPRAPRPTAAVLDLPPTPGETLSLGPADVAISPDGRQLAYVAADSTDVPRLWVRALDSRTAHVVPESGNADHPFWSPDGRWIGYSTNGEGACLKKVPAAGGTPVKLCDLQWSRGNAWGKNGDILFSPSPNSALSRISENGGAITAATELDSTRGEKSHRNPCFLPDGDHFIFSAVPAIERGWAMYVASLRSHTVKRIGSALSAGTWVEPGYLLFDRDGRVVAQRFDLKKLELVGDVTPLSYATPLSQEDATRIATGSTNGRLAVLRSEPLRVLEWRNRTGAVLGRPQIPSAFYYELRLTPDAQHAAVGRIADRFGVQVVRVDFDRGIATALTDRREYNDPGCWSPDGRTIAISSVREGGIENIGVIPADGSGPIRLLETSNLQFKSAVCWSPDGKSIVISQLVPGSSRDLFVVDAEHGGKPRLLVGDPGLQDAGSLSPDGHWLAYDSDETGTSQIYLRRFPDGADKIQITRSGCTEPEWTHNGRELVFIGNDRRSFFTVPFEGVRAPLPGSEKVLFRTPFDVDFGGWDVTRDGERFLMLAPDRAARAPSTTIVVDWTAMLTHG